MDYFFFFSQINRGESGKNKKDSLLCNNSARLGKVILVCVIDFSLVFIYLFNQEVP